MSSENKKGKGKVVPSRFMQSAEKYFSDGTSSGTNKTCIAKRKNETRIDRNITTNTNRFSTPEGHAALPAFDASAISNTTVDFKPQRRDNLRLANLASTGVKPKKQPSASHINASTALKTNRFTPNQISENLTTKDLDDEIDIYHSRYLLAVLMKNKAMDSLKLRSCDALEKFYEVYQYVGLLLRRHENLEKELNLASYVLKLHEHLQKQDKTLLPILESIPIFEKQYEEIAVAVDSVRHKLQTKDIYLPEDGHQGEITQLMEKAINLIEQILQTTNNVEEIVSTAESAKDFVNRGKAIAEEIKRASEQLSETRELLLSETSLKFAYCTIKDD